MNLIFISIWIIGYVVMELHCYYIKRYKRYEWNKRQHGLISFSNKQFFYMRLFWPITTFVSLVLIFILLIATCIRGITKD